MELCVPQNLKLVYSTIFLHRPLSASCFTLLSLFATFLYFYLVDFARSFVVPPKHFSKRGWSQMLFRPQVDVPLVELKEGSKDFKEVLLRGSEQV